ncbi:hypothetical protein [Alteromonas gilva]|uniref:Uncharacterized protein n=1 Tax=Alteromonas gilva TaxID=2987522 RepID=A0ABT5L717_9ALTE|nr:hypothetical protein [Alteromonas gilva]MDC8832865.1 hypothetical protein [Alteromonas gilva]
MKSILLSIFALVFSLNAHAWCKSNSADVITVNQEHYVLFTFYGCDKSESLEKYSRDVFVSISAPDFVLLLENTARTGEAQAIVENALRARKGVVAHLRDEKEGSYPSSSVHYSAYKITERQAKKLVEIAAGGVYTISSGTRFYKD